MPDEPSLGELDRRMKERFEDLKDDFRELGSRLDKKVDQTLYDFRHEALTRRIVDLEQARKDDAAKLETTRRWRIASVIIPIISVIVALAAVVVAVVVATAG